MLTGFETYFIELARWNRKMNLSALSLDGDGSDEAVDRLLMEPAVASRHIPDSARTLLDVGSGGGSPAIPIKICRPDLALTMVEVKVRKSVFLRQVSRSLSLARTQVETSRFEE
ncbi:MAG: RsmG family class I SAM-dependent methyltransferase, partial [Acidobacteriota bacterium]